MTTRPLSRDSFAIVEADASETRSGNRRAAGWLAVFAVPLAVWALIGWVHSESIPPDVEALRRAEFRAGASETPPGSEGAWKPRLLPDDWMRSRPGTGEGWYRIAFEIDRPTRERGFVYLPSVIMNAAVYLNGERIGDGGRFDDPVARNWARPLGFSVSSVLLREGWNHLDVRVKADRVDGGLLGPIYVGSERMLGPVFTWSYGAEVTAQWAICIGQIMIALATLTLWALRRSEPYYGWFGLAVLAWVGAELNALVTTIPVPLAVWYWFSYASIGWWGIFAVLLLLSFVGDLEPKTRRRLLLFGTVGSSALAALAAGEPERFHLLASTGWLTSCAAVAAYTAGYRVVTVSGKHPNNLEFRVACVLGITVVGAVFYDLAMQLGLRPRGGAVYPPYTAPFVVTGMGWLLGRRFLHALERSETLAAGLEEDVRRKTEEVKRSHVRLREVEAKRVLSEERERIMHDVREGVGSQITSTLALLELSEAPPDRLAGAMRSALDDLRLMIDSLDPAEGNLVVALAMVRARLQPRFDAARIQVSWRVEDVPSVPDFGPHKVLQALRILQTVFLGLAAEAPSSTLTVRTGTDVRDGTAVAAYVEIEVSGGVGTPPPSPKYAMDKIHERAGDIGAGAELHSTATGSVFRLSLPLAANR